MHVLRIIVDGLMTMAMIVSACVMILLLLVSCSRDDTTELEGISETVLKHKKGIEITIEPLDEGKK